METTTLDKLYLEWSQFTKAKTAKELRLQEVLDAAPHDDGCFIHCLEPSRDRWLHCNCWKSKALEYTK